MNNTVNRASVGAKKNKFFKSGFCEKLKLLLIPIGLLIGSLTTQVWGWYTIYNANVLYDDSKSGWNSNVVIALEKWENWANNDGHGCAVFSMGQVANTKVWRWYGSWGDNGVNVIRFGSTTSTYDWYGWWSNDNGTVDESYDLAERDKWSGYSGTWGGSISSAAKMFGANSSSKGAALTKTDLTSYTDLNNITITVKAKVSTNNGKTYSETTSPATLSASSYKFSSYTTCNTASSLSSGTITCGYTATTTLTAPTTDPAGYKFEGWYNSSGTRETTNKTLTINPNSNATYYAYYRKLFKINAGATIVWDLGEKKNGSTAINWSNAYLRQDIYGGSQPHDALTHLGSGSQWSKTYASASSYMNAFMFRARNDGTWNGLEQTTNITTDVSNVTILTYKNTVTNEDSKDKLDWEVVTDGKKGASGRTVYFDDTNTKWGSGKMFFNYGVDYTTSGGFHRKIDFAATKVPGTENLWKLKASLSDATNQGATNSSGQLSHDIYFQKWYVSKSYGYTNHNPITDSHVLERTEIYTDEIVSNDFTLIPTTKKSGGSGTDGSPYIWNTTKMTGYKHTVTIGSHTNGTITLHYTDENGASQNPTITTDVAHTCIVNATATANNGYDYTSMTKGGVAYTPGTNHTVRADVTFAATFTAHTYSITLNAGDHGEANGSASVVFNTSSLESVTHVSANDGYELIGYYDGETKVLNANGSFADANVDGYITSGKWSKYDANATLTAKFNPITFTIEFNANGGDGEMADQNFTYDATQALTANAFTKAGCYFEGWAETADGAVVKRDQADGCTLSTTNGATKTLYAKWKAISSIATDCWDGDTYKCAEITNLATPEPAATATWSGANWGGTPSLTTDVVIPANMAMTVNVDHAQAKSISLGSSSTLSINANKGLEIAGTITKADGSAPTASDLVLESSASGNATLIFNNSNSAAATVQMYSKSVIADEDTWNWQYIGSPYVSASALHNYYGCYLKKWGDPSAGWNDVANGASVEPWKAYSVTQESTSTFVMEGILVPTDNIVELDIPDKPSWIVANSWTAPIYIDAMGEAFDEETEKTVYLFNTGFAPNGASAAATGSEESRYAAGTYLSVPVNSAVSMGNPFISSMQGFVVKNTTSPRKPIKLTLNYSTMVRPAIDREIAGGKMHAPKNIQEDEQPTVLKMLARGTNYDDCLYLLERADFTTGFDNGWDGSKLGDNAVAPRLYTTREDGTKESVSAVPELEGSVLTFRAGEDNVYTFQFEYSEEAETLYLLDLDKNIYTRVLTGSTYTFTTNDKVEHPRFILTRYGAPQITTGVDEVYKANSARKQMINGTLYIIRDGRIYNAEGTLVK